MYLIPSDYKKQIQTENLNQVIAGNSAILASAEAQALEELAGYLRQKYEIEAELSPTTAWSRTAQYKVGDRVYITGPAFNAANTYAQYDLVVQAGFVYQANGAVPAGAFNPAQWTQLGADFQAFYPKSPYPEFNVYAPYKISDVVFWKGKAYTCRVASTFPSFPPDIQVGYYELQPLPNVFPDDPNNGVTYWGSGTPYVVTNPSNVLDATQWVQGDARCQQVVTLAVDITLYHIHSRISPNNIPELRINRYIGQPEDRLHVHGRGMQFPEYCAIGTLQAFAEGRMTPTLAVKQPRQGARIRYGGRIKQSNHY